MLKSFLLSAFFFLSTIVLLAQGTDNIRIAQTHIQNAAKTLNLSQEDVQNLYISNTYITKHNQVQHVYLLQTVNEVPVHNGTFGVHIKDGEVLHFTSNGIANIANKTNATSTNLSVEEAILSAAKQLGYSSTERLERLPFDSKQYETYKFAPTSFSNNPILARLMYYNSNPNELKLAWIVDLDVPGSDYYSVRVDALTGSIIDKYNYTVYCSFDHVTPTALCAHNHGKAPAEIVQSSNSAVAAPSYKIYQFPIESPIHGDHKLVADPSDKTASPYGWHDTDGVEGPEFTITRGNNVHAYTDTNGDDQSDQIEPDGTSTLTFDFSHDQLGEPNESHDAAQVNLFYANNHLHDFMHFFGFDESAGNFQSNNYGNGGAGDDYVRAESADGSGLDNANFATPIDGFQPRMQMYLWGGNESDFLSITEPAEIVGSYDTRLSSNSQSPFGPALTDVPLVGELVYGNDNIDTPNDGCQDLVGDHTGKIVMIDRGMCDFSLKVYNAQQAGAIAAIVCNVPGVNGGNGDDDIFSMAAGEKSDEVTIPSIMARYSDCKKFKASLANNIKVSASLQLPQQNGPKYLDCSYDNGVIAHEYGHGISNRLVGGPGNSSCLGNDEQMGEGWSDFYTLALTALEGDKGTDGRGIGTYVKGQKVDGPGIRDYRYSTDITKSPKTFDDIIGTSAPHPLGEVWTACVWDLYWGLVDIYGFDQNYKNKESGNYKAVLLVTDGLKMTKCSPGFVDGRDAILAADKANFGGEHECLIWSVFARRGVGYYADQKSPDDRNDGVQDFEPLPTCIKELKIRKEATGLIEIGGNIDVSIEVVNHKNDLAENVKVTDILINGQTYVAGSSSIGEPTISGNTLVWNLGNLEFDKKVNFTYQLKSDPNVFSVTNWIEDFELGDDNWDVETTEGTGTFWELKADFSNSGDFSLGIYNIEAETDNRAFMLKPVKLNWDNPILKFRHRLNTEKGSDAGFLAIKVEGESTYKRIKEDIGLRNNYNSSVQYGTFAIPALKGFSGSSEEKWLDSYFDLSAYQGKDVYIQFRFGTDDNTIPANGAEDGWFIDDIEFIALKNYINKTCVTDDSGSENCATTETYVESKMNTSTQEEEEDTYNVTLSPNPATKEVNITFENSISADLTLKIVNNTGVTVFEKTLRGVQGIHQEQILLHKMIPGLYFVHVVGDQKMSIKKLVIE